MQNSQSWDEVAEDFKVTSRTIRLWHKDGAPIVLLKESKSIEVDYAELRAWMKANNKQGYHGSPPRIRIPSVGTIGSKTRKEISQEINVQTEDIAVVAKALSKELESKYGKLDDEELKRRLVEAELRKREADANLKELDLKVKNGELLKREDVERGRIQRIYIVKSNMLSLPAKLSARLEHLNATEIDKILKQAVEEMAELFAEEFEAI